MAKRRVVDALRPATGVPGHLARCVVEDWFDPGGVLEFDPMIVARRRHSGRPARLAGRASDRYPAAVRPSDLEVTPVRPGQIDFRFRGLLAGAERGAYTLPAEILEQLEVVRRLDAFQVSCEPTAPAVRVDLADATLAAAEAGKAAPSGATLLKAEADDRAARLRRWCLTEVADLAVMTLETTTICSSLPLGSSMRPMTSAPPTASSLTSPSGIGPFVPQSDARLSRGASKLRAHGAPKPWPDEPVASFVWTVTSAAEPWMPTPEEQDERWMEVFGDAANSATLAKKRQAGAAAARMFGARTAAVYDRGGRERHRVGGHVRERRLDRGRRG